MIGRLHSRHRAIEFKRFLHTLDQEVPAELDLHVVLDNSSTQKTPEQRWLGAPLRFVFHTPTGSSWPNLVERWFANKQLHRGAHRSARELSADIRARIEHWNQNPRPFVRTKTAEQILNRSPGTAVELGVTTLEARVQVPVNDRRASEQAEDSSQSQERAKRDRRLATVGHADAGDDPCPDHGRR